MKIKSLFFSLLAIGCTVSAMIPQTMTDLVTSMPNGIVAVFGGDFKGIAGSDIINPTTIEKVSNKYLSGNITQDQPLSNSFITLPLDKGAGTNSSSVYAFFIDANTTQLLDPKRVFQNSNTIGTSGPLDQAASLAAANDTGIIMAKVGQTNVLLAGTNQPIDAISVQYQWSQFPKHFVFGQSWDQLKPLNISISPAGFDNLEGRATLDRDALSPNAGKGPSFRNFETNAP